MIEEIEIYEFDVNSLPAHGDDDASLLASILLQF
jgi:hypothetical protein